ncbi:MAG: AMP-binding protein [Candidatus Lokiarchaeota archaeon]|nr:AMP-binding protein [Candidatus Lokiarchaeota archaeon]
MRIALTPNEKAYEELRKLELKKYNDSLFKGVGSYLEYQANQIPNRPAILFEDKCWTWDELNQESNRFANYFLNLGLKYDDVVAIIMENCPEYLFSSTGINKIQGISSLINVNQRRSALEHVVKVSDPKWIVIDGDNLPNLLEIEENLEIPKENILVINNFQNIKHEFVNLNLEMNKAESNNPPTTLNSTEDQICVYLFSSGTTGYPKAISLSNIRLMSIGIHGSIVLKLSSEEIVYVPTPLYHGLGFNVAWIGAVWGGAAIAIRKRFSSSNYWKDISKFKATCTVYIGEIPRYLLNLPENEYEKQSTLKRMIGLGLKKNIWLKFKERFNIEHIYEYYASTEVGGYINLDNTPGMVGRITSPAVLLAKFNRDTGEFYKNQDGFHIPCKPGEEGIALANLKVEPHFIGYKYREQTEKKLLKNVFETDDLYFYTGDLLKLHANNWVSFVDRLGNTFRWKGENVSTTEVEAILNSHSPILGSNVFGVELPNAEGRAGMAAIRLNEPDGFDISEFFHFLSENLPKYAIPLFIRIQTDPLETTGNFKLRKTNLQKKGFNIEEISDIIYVLLPGKSEYTLLTTELYQSIKNKNYVF